MDGNLSLAQSLGGLRIANPDDASSSSPSQSLGRESSMSALSASRPAMENGGQGSHPLSPPSLPDNCFRSASPLGFNPRAFSTNTTFAEPQPARVESSLTSGTTDTTHNGQRHPSHQPIPLTYQDQQHAQFPQQPTMMPLSHQNPTSNSRPLSSMYTQPPPVSIGNQLLRD